MDQKMARREAARERDASPEITKLPGGGDVMGGDDSLAAAKARCANFVPRSHAQHEVLCKKRSSTARAGCLLAYLEPLLAYWDSPFSCCPASYGCCSHIKLSLRKMHCSGNITGLQSTARPENKHCFTIVTADPYLLAIRMLYPSIDEVFLQGSQAESMEDAQEYGEG